MLIRFPITLVVCVFLYCIAFVLAFPYEPIGMLLVPIVAVIYSFICITLVLLGGSFLLLPKIWDLWVKLRYFTILLLPLAIILLIISWHPYGITVYDPESVRVGILDGDVVEGEGAGAVLDSDPVTPGLCDHDVENAAAVHSKPRDSSTAGVVDVDAYDGISVGQANCRTFRATDVRLGSLVEKLPDIGEVELHAFADEDLAVLQPDPVLVVVGRAVTFADEDHVSDVRGRRGIPKRIEGAV